MSGIGELFMPLPGNVGSLGRSRFMHIERFTDRDRRVVYTTVTGEITAKEIFADIKRLSTDPSFDPGMAGFVDMRKATAHLAANEIQRIAYIVKTNPRIAGPTRRALLVSTDLLYGIYRMFEAYAAGGVSSPPSGCFQSNPPPPAGESAR
jgi:hypothetical protein